MFRMDALDASGRDAWRRCPVRDVPKSVYIRIGIIRAVYHLRWRFE
jgi:hypothetical protein